MRFLYLIFVLSSTFGFSQSLETQENFPIVQIEKFHKNGNLKIKKVFNSEKYMVLGKKVLENYIEYYNNEQLYLKFTMRQDKIDGELVAYWKNGNIKRKAFYKSGKLIDGKMWDKYGKEITYSKFEITSILKS